MRVLVTGHDGYIGAVLVPRLLREGYEVVGLDSSLFGACQLPGIPPAPEVPLIGRDLREAGPSALTGIDAVLHLAALSNDPLGALDETLTTEINFTASLRLAEAAREAGVERFLFSSSCSTYGAAGEAVLDESAPFRPVTAYAREKVRLEQALGELADDSFSPVYLRNATAYGLSPRHRLDLVLNNLVGWAVTTGKVLMLSDGTPWRPLVHVEDIASAFVALLRAPRDLIHDQAFNVGRNEHNYRILELGEIVVDAVPGSKLEMAPGAGPDKRSYRVDFSKLERTVPDWRPQWDARRSAERLSQAYRAAKLQRSDLEASPYIRLKHLEALRADGVLDERLRWRV